MLIWIIIAAAVVALDQLAKILVMTGLSATDTLHVIPKVIDFVYVKNTGAAFSIFSNNTALLAIISVLFCIGVGFYWYKTKPQNRFFCLALTLLFAGALGNAIDRVFRGFVVDFISTAFIRFPVFNIADIAITAGAVILAVYLLFFDKEEVQKDGESDAFGNKGE